MNKNTSGLPSIKPGQLSEALASLHVRNIRSEDSPKLERSQATEANDDADTRKAATNVNSRTKGETSTDVEDAERPEREESLPKAAKAVAPSVASSSGSELSTWEQEEDRLEAKSMNHADHSLSNLNHAPQNPTTTTSAAAPAQSHGQTNLPAGGTHVPVPPTQTRQKVPNAVATTFKALNS